MKSVVALIVALALAFGAGSLCAAPAAVSMQAANMECGDMREAATAHIIMAHRTWRGSVMRASLLRLPSAPI